MSEIVIITPVYNCEAYISQTIKSVQAQSFSDWEHILIDDGSKDESFAIIQKLSQQDKRIRPYRIENCGSSGARNFGVSKINSDPLFIMFLDHDDFLEPDALAVLRDDLLENPEYSAAYGLARRVAKDGTPIDKTLTTAYRYNRYRIENRKRVPVPENEPSDLTTFVDWDNIATPGQVLIRYQKFLIEGGFDTFAEPNEDWDLWLKLTRKGPFGRINRFVINYRLLEGSISDDNFKMRRSELLIRRKIALSAKYTKEHAAAIRYGHFYSVCDRFVWPYHSLRQGKILRAGKQFLLALRASWMYIKTWHLNFSF